MSHSTIMVVEDDAALREALIDTLQLAGYQASAASSAEQALICLRDEKIDLVVSDIQMSGMGGLALLNSIKGLYPSLPVLLMTAYANVDDAVSAMRLGATDYLCKPFAPEVLLNVIGRYVPTHQIAQHSPVVEDPASEHLLALARKVACTDASVMILGPSGSGKEVLSRYIHQQSMRAEGPFVAINCAAIPENMLEATLFGYEKGAFTGAVQACPGKFEQAQQGTLLLDEITEMDLGLQAKLLRVIQEKEVERLGARKAIKLDVRIIATSNRDLKQAIAEGKFREDLFYRLNVFPLTWLPLSQRPGDIVPLAEHLIQRHAKARSQGLPTLTEAAKTLLIQHNWPGNVRELDNVIQRALILCDSHWIDTQDLMLDMTATLASHRPVAMLLEEDASHLGNELRQQEHQLIIEALQRCQGSRKRVAETLGISPRTLRYKLARMRDEGIEIPA